MATFRFDLRQSTAMKLIASLAFGCAAMVSTPAPAQNFDPIITVEPAIAGPGVARRISISMLAPCDFSPTVPGNEAARKRTFVVRLDIPRAIFCDVIFRRESSISYTPGSEGELRVHVVTDSGAYVGETVIKTRAPDSNRSQVELTGMWYDPASYGSGLTFIHGATREDTVFGTWYVYDGQGAPRWYTIQGVQWMAGGLQAVGQLYWTNASSVVCLPPFTACPVAFSSVTPIARVSIVMQGPNSARIIALKPEGVLVTNLIRSIF